MSISKTIKKDKNACPPEMFKRFGDFPVSLIHGRVYGRIKNKNVPVAKLVWKCHRANGKLKYRQQIYHIDGDRMNNNFDNLTLWRSLCAKSH